MKSKELQVSREKVHGGGILFKMVYKKKWSASEIIRMQYKGYKNYFTPNKLKIGKINPDIAYELSQGESILRGDGQLFGVTVVAVNKKKWQTRGLDDVSQAFSERNEAEAYINKLKNKMGRKRR